MSFQTMTWAAEQSCGSSSAKLVLLMLANHSNGHTGQCNPRHKLLAAECDMTVETLKTNLKKLEAMGLIEIVSQFMDGVQLPNQYVLNGPRGGGKNSGEGGGKFSPEGGGKNTPSYKQEGKQEDNHESFGLFWQAYPKKKDKETARKAWVKVPADLHPVVMDALAKQSQSQDWLKEDGKYIPLAATWINGKRWEDEDEGDTRTLDIWAGAL